MFAAYSRPNDSLRCASALRWRVSVGSVAPIRTVAGARARSARPSRSSGEDAAAPPRAPRQTSPYSARMTRNVNGVSEDDDHEHQLDQAVQPQRRAHPVGQPAADARCRSPSRRRSRPGSPTRPGSCCRTRARAGVTRRSRTSGRPPPRQHEDREDGPARGGRHRRSFP